MAPSSATVLRTASQARLALDRLAAAVPALPVAAVAVGKRGRAADPGLLDLLAHDESPDGEVLHILQKKKARGRPRRSLMAMPASVATSVGSGSDGSGPASSSSAPSRQYPSPEDEDEALPKASAATTRGQHLPQSVTDLLVAWTIEHKRSPYPTNGATLVCELSPRPITSSTFCVPQKRKKCLNAKLVSAKCRCGREHDIWPSGQEATLSTHLQELLYKHAQAPLDSNVYRGPRAAK